MEEAPKGLVALEFRLSDVDVVTYWYPGSDDTRWSLSWACPRCPPSQSGPRLHFADERRGHSKAGAHCLRQLERQTT